MKPVRVIIFSVAVVSAGLAGFLALKVSGNRQVATQQPVEHEPAVSVLVASKSLPVGSRLDADSVRWSTWPEDGVVEGLITQQARPNAVTDLAGAVVRLPIFDGEPVRAEKVVDSSSRILSSMLPAGKRAVATEISIATGAGGFILPNDRVDVIMVREANDIFNTEIVLSNVRVLAIDQQIEEKQDGSKSVIGTTATLELTPAQSQVMAAAQQMAKRLTLALRSVADAQDSDTTASPSVLSGAGSPAIQIIKSGSIVTGSQPSPIDAP